MARSPEEHRPNNVPLWVTGTGAITALAGLLYVIETGDAITAQAQREFSPISSVEDLAQAKKEVEIFDRTTHTLITQGELTISVPKVTADPQRLVRSMRTIEQEKQQSQRQIERREELYREQLTVDLSDPKLSPLKISAILVIGGFIAAASGVVMDSKRLRQNRNQPAQARPQGGMSKW